MSGSASNENIFCVRPFYILVGYLSLYRMFQISKEIGKLF